ncbi:MAG TPA: AmmeMemoRadiSam system protein A [Anaerolineales bacterium]|nr:AmmeMemoRadiSam system protein A [Anaerolineales bacterium]
MAGSLSPSERSALLSLARRAVGLAAERQPLPPIDPGAFSASLQEAGCSFVTLTRQGALRGCIGGLEPLLPLVEDVWQHAYAAAREDPRFAPVSPDELGQIAIEISRLTPAAPLAGPLDQIPSALHPGIDGVILQQGRQRATFLPQVWEKIEDPEVFLDMLADKAGLPRSAWRTGDAEVLVYQVESFEE